MYIGIDLGTSNSAIVGLIDGKARIFRPTDGGEVLPSVIYIDKRGHRLYGRRAYDQALIAPEHVAMGFKRLMGTATPIEIPGAGLSLSPEECSAEILRQLIGQAMTEVGEDEKITGAIIAVPAAFNQMQSEATLRAAKLAGLDHVDLVQEPVAAALAALSGNKRAGKFLIYDLGGGTFDVSIAEATAAGDVRILAQQGINMLGGRDFDRMIVHEIVRPWLLANFDLPDGFHRDPPYRRLMRVAALAAERAKIDLSTNEEATVFASDDEVRLMDQNETEIFLDAPMTRAQFEELIRRPILQTVDMIRMLLDEQEMKPADIDRIVFVGGPTRIPLVRALVADELGIAPDLQTDPMTAVATGAAYYAESRQWEGTAIEAKAQQSAPKAVEAVEDKPLPVVEPGLKLDYVPRTTEDKTVLTLRLDDVPETHRQVQVTTEGWDSGVLPLSDILTVMVPLPTPGDHIFTIKLQDQAGAPLGAVKTITITRTVATAKTIPATQTIAVKVLENAEAQTNTLLPLVTKGNTLPAEGSASFKSATTLKSGMPGALCFEVFQVEYPERVDLNLCIGLFRVTGADLPAEQVIRTGDSIIFDWRMSDGGILQASVRFPDSGFDLKAPRFYAPQAAQVSFDPTNGPLFARAVLARGEDEWGDLSAALGPEAGPEVQLLKTRLDEQKEILEESVDEPEALRQMVEETRFIRQDIARQTKKNAGPMTQRHLGKLQTVFNRVARAKADKKENDDFDTLAAQVQDIIDAKDPALFDQATLYMAEMRRRFFAIAWRDAGYIRAWFKRLGEASYLFPDKDELQGYIKQGEELIAANKDSELRDLVARMLDARITLGASDNASELASIVKG
jgi:molecular chaperone DnaK